MPGAGRLARVARVAEVVGDPGVAAEARALAERLAEGRFYVVCLGQFKRGKSTLLNALVGEPVLPAGVIPITSAVTVVRHGPALAARVRFGERDWEDCEVAALPTYVSEEQNPGNEKGVTGVEVLAPCALLASGLCLVDTPGVGSISLANTAATRAFVPHVDAALVVVGVDPPISGEELALVAEVAEQTPELIVVMNKADRHPDRDRQVARQFTARALGERLGRPAPPILEVSATERLTGAGPSRDWEALVGRLRELATARGSDLLVAAEARGAAHLVGRLLHEIDEQEAALLRPVHESQARIERLRAVVVDAGHSIDDLGPRLLAVQERLVRQFTEAHDAFLATALEAVTAELHAAVAGAATAPSSLRSHALDEARAIAGRWLDRWRQTLEPQAQALYQDAVARFVDLLDRLGQDLAASGLGGLGGLDAEAVLSSRTAFYFTEMLHIAPASASRRLLDTLAPRRWRDRWVEADAREYLLRVLEVNAARVKNDFIERIARSRRTLEAQLRERLAAVVASAERAAMRAREAQAAGAEAVRERLAALGEARATLEALRQEG